MNPTSCSINDRGKYIPWIIAAFFTGFVLLLLSFVWIAFANKPSVVTDHAYEKGLAYNHVLDKAKAQLELQWNGVLAMDGTAVTFTLNDAQKNPIAGAQVKGWLVRPSSSAMDQAFELSESSPGHYTGNLDLPQPGLWTLHVTALYHGQQFQASRSFESR